MKGRIALFAGYFVGMLLVASWFTGVIRDGVLPKVLRSPDAARLDSAPAGSEDEGPALSSSTETGREEPTVAHGGVQLRVGRGRPQGDPTGVSERDAVREALEAKRAELDRLEERLRRQKEQNLIEERRLAEMRSSSAMMSKERDARRETGIIKLARLYEGMEPEAAASILGSLDKDLATDVLASMKDRRASKVLGAMNGRRARDLSERLQEARPSRATSGETYEHADATRKGPDADR